MTAETFRLVGAPLPPASLQGRWRVLQTWRLTGQRAGRPKRSALH